MYNALLHFTEKQTIEYFFKPDPTLKNSDNDTLVKNVRDNNAVKEL